MKKLPALLDSWKTDSFDDDLLRALQCLEPYHLPLKQVARYSGLFNQDSLQFSILNKNEYDDEIVIKLSLFYQEISTFCPCSGEEPENMDGHCELAMSIDKQDGNISFKIIA